MSILICSNFEANRDINSSLFVMHSLKWSIPGRKCRVIVTSPQPSNQTSSRTSHQRSEAAREATATQHERRDRNVTKFDVADVNKNGVDSEVNKL